MPTGMRNQLKALGQPMESIPRISIVTPSFNQGGYLAEAIGSVLDQGYQNLEYVVIDGSSDDGSRDIIERQADRLHYWESQPDRGHAHALNKGFAHTSGEIMGWLNSDDKQLPWALEVVAEVFSQFPEVRWISGIPGYWDSNGRLMGTQFICKNRFNFALGDYRWIQQESVFWRRDLWDEAGGYVDEQVQFAVDGELWGRFFALTDLYTVECVLSGYRYHADNRASANFDRLIAEMEGVSESVRLGLSKADRHLLRKLSLGLPAWKLRGKRLPLARLARAFSPASFQTAAFPVIRNESGMWRKDTRPFSYSLR